MSPPSPYVTPGNAAALDIAFDHLVPGEMRIGRRAVAKNPQMHNETDTALCCGIDDRLTLMHHLYGVPGHEVEAINPSKRLRKGPCVVEIEVDGVLPLPLPGIHLIVAA